MKAVVLVLVVMVVVVCTTKIVTEMVAASVATPLPLLVQGCCRQYQHHTDTAKPETIWDKIKLYMVVKTTFNQFYLFMRKI